MQYMLKKVTDIATLKAICQNLMHANLRVTDDVYGILSDNDVRTQIPRLGNKKIEENINKKELVTAL